MMVGHIKPLYQAAPDQIVRFDMITESYVHPRLHQKMGVQKFASLLVYHFWMLHEEPIKKQKQKAYSLLRVSFSGGCELNMGPKNNKL